MRFFIAAVLVLTLAGMCQRFEQREHAGCRLGVGGCASR